MTGRLHPSVGSSGFSQLEPATSAAQPLSRVDGAGTGVCVGLFGARKKLPQVEAARVEAGVQTAVLAREAAKLRTPVAELALLAPAYSPPVTLPSPQPTYARLARR
jgi:hypothetical protein